ncbi:MAG: HD domain-containing protein [Holophagales bacterium]|nr:HD domain-containing protein [Holophagales bacterium]MYG28867.1 HD domain-containing protein [Holophagales bacterium]MYI80811.1 HD domain-containing protein [Holophagales bacterium]
MVGDPGSRLARHPAWPKVLQICRAAAERGGCVRVVGGSVRDAMLERPFTEFDLEAFRIEPMDLDRMLEDLGLRVDRVGRAFSVVKLRGVPVDVALPRREVSVGAGHRDFLVDADPDMTVEEAAERRDYTINAISYEPLAGRVDDPLGGQADLERRRLRHASHRFTEDPLRVLRGMQLVARLGLEPDPDTVRLCSGIDWRELSVERVFEEWRKLLLRGIEIGRGLRFLEASGWLQAYPELQATVGCGQDPEWHPEGDVWTHTGHVLDAFATERLGEEEEDLVVGLACVCHDLGKPATTRFVDGRLRSRGHEAAGEAPTRSFLARLTNQRGLVDDVVRLVVDHLKPRQLYQGGAGDAAVRRLAHRVKRIDRLVRVARADARGRPPLPPADCEDCDWLLSRAEALRIKDQAPTPLVLGRDLIARGLPPGPEIGVLVDRCYQAQLDGAFEERTAGLRFLDSVLRRRAVAGRGPGNSGGTES